MTPTGNVLTETDPDNYVTTYTYNDAGQVASTTQNILRTYGGTTTTAKTTCQYDADGNLVETADALANAGGGTGTGNVIVYTYNALDEQTGESWYTTVAHANAGTDCTATISYTYDADGEMTTAQQTGVGGTSGYYYTYNSLGQQASVDNNNAAEGVSTSNVPDVVLASTYDGDGDRTSLSATIGGTADFVNTYSYDSSDREVQVTQGPAAGKSNVDPKTVSFTYDADGEVSTIDRFNALNTASGHVVKTTYGYDSFGRITGLTHSTSTPIDDAWTYDADGEVKSFSDSANTGDDFSGCTYDNDGQLESDTGGFEPVSNTYDDNGNATSLDVGVTSTSIGAGNTVLFDGTNSYQYNADGQVVLSWTSPGGAESAPGAGDSNIMSYSWDARGRLASVKAYSSCTKYTSGNYQLVTYSYDMFSNLIGRTVTTYASGVPTGSTTQRFVFDGTNMVLAFDGSDNLTDRYLWGPAVDQVLADEYFPSPTSQLPSAAGTTLWMLGDNQNSVTDVVGDSGTLYEHIDYSPFGVQNVSIKNTPPAGYVLPVGFTGTYTDPVTGYQLHGARWYNPVNQRWLSQDPSGLSAGPNPYEYCGNGPTDGTDTGGFAESSDSPPDQDMVPSIVPGLWLDKPLSAIADYDQWDAVICNAVEPESHTSRSGKLVAKAVLDADVYNNVPSKYTGFGDAVRAIERRVCNENRRP